MFEYPYLTLAQAADDGAPVLPQQAPQPQQPAGGEQTNAPGAPGSDGQAPPPAPSPFSMFLPIILIMVVFFVLTVLPQRKEKKRREAMIAALKKNDRVQTTGGLLGTVVEVRDSEVVLKVDENSNTRVRVIPGAILTVFSDKEE